MYIKCHSYYVTTCLRNEVNIKNILGPVTKLGNTEETKICNDYFSIFDEHVLAFEIFVEYSFVMQITHALLHNNKGIILYA